VALLGYSNAIILNENFCRGVALAKRDPNLRQLWSAMHQRVAEYVQNGFLEHGLIGSNKEAFAGQILRHFQAGLGVVLFKGVDGIHDQAVEINLAA